MPRISGLVHVCNHERQLGRALLSLRFCDEILVVDHGSTDGTLRIAREHGARIIQAARDIESGADNAANDWILCLLPCEAIAEDLEATLLEWKTFGSHDDQIGYTIGIREQIGIEWRLLPSELRLANRKKVAWRINLPANVPNSDAMEGYILRIPNWES